MEHFLSVFYILNLSDIIIETPSEEFPILNGSVDKILNELQKIEFEIFKSEIPIFKCIKNIEIKDKEKYIILEPFKNLSIKYEIDYPEPIGHQNFNLLKISKAIFKKEISKARTFGFYEDFQNNKIQNISLGANYNNTLVASQEIKSYINKQKYRNECIRHKILDLIGDLALSEGIIQGKLRCYKTGHYHHIKLIKKFFDNFL